MAGQTGAQHLTFHSPCSERAPLTLVSQQSSLLCVSSYLPLLDLARLVQGAPFAEFLGLFGSLNLMVFGVAAPLSSVQLFAKAFSRTVRPARDHRVFQVVHNFQRPILQCISDPLIKNALERRFVARTCDRSSTAFEANFSIPNLG